MSTESDFTLWVDADACPVAIKEIIFRTSRRLKLKAVLVANGTMRIPKTEWIQLITVPHGADAADDHIVESSKAGDLVVTADIPLAARVVKRGAVAIGTRGQLYDDDSIHGRLATRDLMDQLRSAGVETAGPKPLDPKDVQAFANQLDRQLTRMLRKRS